MIHPSIREYLRDQQGLDEALPETDLRSRLSDCLADGRLSLADYSALLDRANSTTHPQTSNPSMEKSRSMSTTISSQDILNLAAESDDVRVKSPSERYATTRYVGKHVRSGQSVRYRGREVELPSQLETAKAGVFLKFLGKRSGINVNIAEHERALLDETIQNDGWCGKVGTEWRTGIRGESVKALLNDSTSGGHELVPDWFDDALITFPLLHSEILPEVDLRDVPRSSNIDGASVGNPTVTWGTAEGTAASLFDTSNFVSQLTTAIHPVAISIEVGNDFLSDTAMNVGEVLLQNIGQRMLEELDRVVVAGNGTSEPQGIVNASGVVQVSAVTPTTGPLTYNDALNLCFGVAKQYRAPAYRPGYIMTDTAYKRFRSIATGVTGDTRPLFGMDVNVYELLQYPAHIEQTGLANNQILFGALQKYRLYRRQGVESRFTSEGQTLTLKNTSLLQIRGRFGGRVLDANAFAVMDNAPA
jgi:HK97 family phage major capsid protein